MHPFSWGNMPPSPHLQGDRPAPTLRGLFGPRRVSLGVRAGESPSHLAPHPLGLLGPEALGAGTTPQMSWNPWVASHLGKRPKSRQECPGGWAPEQARWHLPAHCPPLWPCHCVFLFFLLLTLPCVPVIPPLSKVLFQLPLSSHALFPRK